MQLTDFKKDNISALTFDVPTIKCGGIETSSTSCFATCFSLPLNSTRITLKFVPPRSNA